MQVAGDSRLEIPPNLRDKLRAFRRRVWAVKMAEAVAAAVIGVLAGFLLTYALDRLLDTPSVVRLLILASAILVCGVVPLAARRWILRRRRMDQLARLLSETHPSAGDELLGVIELADNAGEQSRSPRLVQAAIDQVAHSVGSHDLSRAIPNPRHWQRGIAAAVLALVALLLLVGTTAAATNAWLRFVTPWQAIPRYTFAAVEPLPERLVVPHGESFRVAVGLRETTRWQPESAQVRLGGGPPKVATLRNRQYQFDLPGQIAPGTLDVTVGDYRGQTPVTPMLRPELNALRAEIRLPAYLERSAPLRKDVRGASVSVVKGSAATLTATASRELASATVNGQPCQPENQQFSTRVVEINQSKDLELAWQDRFGLSGEKPFRLKIEVTDDEAPLLVCENLPRQKILLDSEVLSFHVRAHDDFGVKRVGIEWKSADETAVEPTVGETVIGAGDPEAELLDLAATFCAADAKIPPQKIAVRVFVEDYLPDRGRVYSPTCVFQVLDPAEHAIWISSQLSRWHRMSLDVRDHEMQLHETNKHLRGLPADELQQPENLQQLAVQAQREQANGRRLKNLVTEGEGLLKEAMRNPEIGVGHLDQWAEMMQVLRDISANRMPSVASLLKKASQGNMASAPSAGKEAPKAGQNRLTQSAAGDAKNQPESSDRPTVPTINDIESSHHQLQASEPQRPDEGKPKQPRLTLPTTKLAGDGKGESPQPPPSDEPIDQAVKEQTDLLAEFEKIVDELNSVLANLEGSTLVKRLKASSRKQQQVASRLASLVSDSFGVSERQKDVDGETFAELADVEATSSQEASHIMDDMSAYFQRSRFVLFGHVLEDMRAEDVTAGLRRLGEELRKENGLSISQAEYWSDAFDRWAEDLVEVTKCGACPGAKAKGSLPPSIVLEVLKMLEAETNLREQTRVAQQARPAVSDTEYMETASGLSETQDGLQKRMDQVVERIRELPDAEADFAQELGLLAEASGVMGEATEILAKPETGPAAIAAETEVIELLLKSKRFNPNAGGGGGADPGGGGGGDTKTPALALVGAGVNASEVREQPAATQATGRSGPGLPEEFRSGLDQYFHQLESWKTN